MRWRGCGNSGEARLSNPVAVLDTTFLICLAVRADNKVTFTVVLLSAGFDMALVNGTGQTELPM